MPFRNKYKRRRFIRRTARASSRRFARRTFRRPVRFRGRRPRATNPTSIRKWGLGVFTPNQLKVKLRYTAFVAGNSDLLMATFRISGNGIFAPDPNDVGHQPRGFDQLNALYFRYYVGGSKVRFRVVVNTANANAVIALEGFPGTTLPTGDIETQLEKKYVRYKFIQQQSNVKSIVGYARTNGVFGLTRTVVRADMDDIEYSGRMPSHSSGGANPSREWSWNLYVQNADQETDTSFGVWVEVDYYCTFWDRITPTPS